MVLLQNDQNACFLAYENNILKMCHNVMNGSDSGKPRGWPLKKKHLDSGRKDRGGESEKERVKG